ncbi:MAG: hypothetical protein IT161_17675 [Bryobacterales bacterium]|nr:hypothetical protein [Bryobacterales bacterium]
MKRLLTAGIIFSLSSGLLLAQPKPKSQKELDAVMAIFNAADQDSRIAAAQNLITKFADTEFKGTALQIMTMAYFEKNDADNVLLYGERTLEVDPKNYTAMLLMSRALSYRTREFDLDKEEKLARADKLAKQALEILKTSANPNPTQVTAEQWETARKDYEAQAYESMGMASMVRKKYDAAIENFKQALTLTAQPTPEVLVQLALAYNNTGKYDEAIAAADKAIADPNASGVTKQRASQEKAKANQNKAKAAAPPKP